MEPIVARERADPETIVQRWGDAVMGYVALRRSYVIGDDTEGRDEGCASGSHRDSRTRTSLACNRVGSK